MDELEYDLVPVEKKPKRRYRKGSKYDPILDSFLENDADTVRVKAENKDANYLRTQLKKRIDARELEDKVNVCVVNGVCYIERLE